MPQEVKVIYGGVDLVSVPNGRTLSLDIAGETPQGNILIKNDTYAQLDVTAATGSIIYITKGSDRIDASEVSGTWTFKIGELGTWTIHSVYESFSPVTDTVNIVDYGVYNKTMPVINAHWDTGTDAEISTLIALDHAGKINLKDYWSIGETRAVSLSAISASGSGWDVGEAQSAQSVELVLMDNTCQGFTLVNENRAPHFIVGQRNSLRTEGYINSSNDNTGGWRDCARRGWCNNGYYNALPSTVKSWFGQFKWKQGKGNSATSGLLETTDYFGLAPEKAIFGSSINSQPDEAALFNHWAWYQTAANRTKYIGGSNEAWHGCSPCSGYKTIFCGVDAIGEDYYITASSDEGLAPFGCI